jgi:hypothetical protein
VTVGQVLRYAWASPCTLVGLLLAILAGLSGAHWRAVAGTLEVAMLPRRPPGSPWWLPFRAITLGHVILGTHPAELARLRVHEQAHVRQYETWGPLFLLAYPADSLWQWLRGRRPYADNRFEVAARQAEAAVRVAADGYEESDHRC